MKRRSLGRRLAWTALLAAGCAAALGAAVFLGLATAPPRADDGRLEHLWRLASKRLAVEGAALVLALGEGERVVAPHDAEDPFRENARHPYFQRVRSDPRTRSFYHQRSHDLPDFAAMADFLRGRFDHGVPDPTHHALDLLELLDEAERGAVYACGDISKMLIQMVQAGGGFGRPVQLDGHIVAELWSRRHAKWIAVDADYDVYFTDLHGEPLSAYEIHQRVRERRRYELVPHVGPSARALFRSQPETLYGTYDEGLAVIYYVQWISQALPRWHPGRSPVMVARVYHPEPDLARRVYYREWVADPARLYAPPASVAGP